jgi:hypothetical protein
MAPVLVANISKLPLQHQEIILRIVTKVSFSLNYFSTILMSKKYVRSGSSAKNRKGFVIINLVK